tara:strand:- start:11860 stop:12465 length:606 start_codon:yes stop_codon:yes gene_type:complete
MSRPFQHRIKKQVEPSSGYGGRIGAPPGTMFTMDFKDSDRDGVDDRHQPGPGMADPRWKGRKPAPPRREGPKFGVGRPKPPIRGGEGGSRPPMFGGGGGGRPPMGRPPVRGGGTPKPPRRGTVKGTRPRPDMPSPKPPRKGWGDTLVRPTRPPIGGGRPKPPRRGRTVKGSRPRPPMPSPRPPMGGGRPPRRVPITLGGIR